MKERKKERRVGVRDNNKAGLELNKIRDRLLYSQLCGTAIVRCSGVHVVGKRGSASEVRFVYINKITAISERGTTG